ncbi:beta-ketoacyl synthase chain length factor [Hymenobacter sp. ASUV-10]|uniref:Beta-ketoacyl synthase chain length factor n=1 Tax=Hymenobacter aranciens TaxID=3063996 RepID=A0ABT9BC36_9BACT|nr:beta-ketoacyl synthase chain length factor [Hymenobacter sp. ASUV-10]MDO7875808.1 beta-ketoacyl synthase chain length factor [Hymenobacter sp. ASUV-10]
MSFYINGIGAVSPQKSFAEALSSKPAVHYGNQLHCQEPDYTAFIDARQLRRLSRIVKLSIAASSQAVQDAAPAIIDGVIVGTGWGCIEDTVTFLEKMVENQEEALSPTAFIHSTHNTIAAQVAFQLKCKGYNTTYSHRSISFESALLDAALLLAETPAQTLLVGGVDELTNTSFSILSRFDLFKQPQELGSDSLFSLGTAGTVAGEGSVFFAVSGVRTEHSYCQVAAVQTLSFGSTDDAVEAARKMLQRHGLPAVDLLLLGNNGDSKEDKHYDSFETNFTQQGQTLKFKHLCGEYPTASAFGLGLGATLLKQNLSLGSVPQSVLFYNCSPQSHQALVLLRAC